MALRQYVGARYVPKFSDINGGEWDNTYTYEPFTIVKHGNDYYTSKKEVPTGIAITNTEYWVLTGNYNGAISELDERVTTNTNNIASAQEDIASAQEDITSAQADINSLKGNLDKRKFILIGDSYALTEQAWESWQSLFESYTGAECVKYADNGGGFVASGSLGTFIDCINNSTGEGITDILVCGGANDNTAHNASATPTAVKAAIATFINAAKNKYPDAKIHIGFIAGSTNSSYFTPLYVNGFNAYLTGSLEQGVNFIDLHNVLRVSVLMHDYLHPTTEGMKKIVYGLINSVYGGVYSSDFNGSTTLTANSDLGVVLPSMSVNIVQNNGIVQINNNDMARIELTSHNLQSWTLLFNIDNNISTNSRCDIFCTIGMIDNGSAQNKLTVIRYLEGGIYVRTLEAASAVTKIDLPPFTMTMIL